MRLAAMADGGGGGLPADVVAAWSGVSAVVGAAVGSAGLWLANRIMGKAAFQAAINNGFKELTASLQAELRRETQEHAAERLTWARDRTHMEGEIRQLRAGLDGLKRFIRAQGVDVPMTAEELDPDHHAPVMIELPGPGPADPV